MELDYIQEVANQCYAWSSFYMKLHDSGQPNSRTLGKFKEEYSGTVDTRHFTGNGIKRKHRIVDKECPVCGEMFETAETGGEARQTCGTSCANKHFRSGLRGGRFSQGSYRTICFAFHEKSCVVCGEHKIVEVHHLDEDHDNNDPYNLIPMCPTHHKYWHSKYKHLVESTVKEYVESLQFCSKELGRLSGIVESVNRV